MMEVTEDRRFTTAVHLDPCRGRLDHVPLHHHPGIRIHRDQLSDMSISHSRDQQNWIAPVTRDEKANVRIHSSPSAKLFSVSEESQRLSVSPCVTSLPSSSPTLPLISKPQSNLPTAMARRNERERKRVRLVNHGFATLRQYLPQGHSKKKLSKMETLRSAISYIKQLQMLLNPQSSDSESMIPQERWASAIPAMDGGPSTSSHPSMTNWEEAMVWSLQRSPGSTGSSPQTSLSPEVELLDFSAFS